MTTDRFSTLLAAGGPIVADGPMGTRLLAAGMGAGESPEAWVLDPGRQPDIRAVHRSYVAAGAQILITSSFGASPTRLAQAGLDGRVAEVNALAAELARSAAGPEVIVAGSIGPTGEFLAPLGSLDAETATLGFALQAAALAEAGVDVLWIETMSDLDEVRAAVAGCRRGAPRLPVVATLSFGSGGATMMGIRPAEAATALVDMGVVAGGANCGTGSAELVPVIAAMHAAKPDLPLVAKPNAGLPTIVDGRTVYEEQPRAMAASAVRLLEAGATVLGSCCGGTADHLRAIAEAVRPRRPSTEREQTRVGP